MSDERVDQPTNLRIHFFYVVLFLTFAIIYLLARDWTRLPGFTDYLNVAATITSLVLGLLAIIYAFVSTGAINQSLGSITSSVGSMREVSVELRAIASEATGIQKRAQERTDDLNGIVQELRASAATIDNRFEAMGKRFEELPTKAFLTEALANKQGTSEPTSGAAGTKFRAFWSDEHVLTLALKATSLLGIVGLRYLQKAADEKKYLDLRYVFKAQAEYVWGFMTACESCGLFAIDFGSSPKAGKKITHVRIQAPQSLSKALEAEWNRRETQSEMIKEFTDRADEFLKKQAPEE